MSYFRIIACLETKPEDFNVIYHEIGHIQYYMAYQNQSSFFKVLKNFWKISNIYNKYIKSIICYLEWNQ